MKQQNNVWKLYTQKPMLYYKRMLHDHLKVGKYDNADENLRKETKSVSNRNNIAEGYFGYWTG